MEKYLAEEGDWDGCAYLFNKIKENMATVCSDFQKIVGLSEEKLEAMIRHFEEQNVDWIVDEPIEEE